jgi:preprotein translocase subunit Sss1
MELASIVTLVVIVGIAIVGTLGYLIDRSVD